MNGLLMIFAKKNYKRQYLNNYEGHFCLFIMAQKILGLTCQIMPQKFVIYHVIRRLNDFALL